jgi:hypothetical protein
MAILSEPLALQVSNRLENGGLPKTTGMRQLSNNQPELG